MQQTNWKRNTGVFLASQAISLFGSSLVQFAIMWHITLTTQSGLYMTISIICGTLPTLFLSPFAGVWADRYERKKLIVLADGSIALSTLVLAIVFLAGYKATWLLFVVSAIRALGGAVQGPAINALMPEMVPEEHLTRVNGINGSLQSLLNLASPALAGALLTALGSIEVIFFIDVITAAIAIFVMLAFLDIPRRVRHSGLRQSGYFTEIREGLSYIYKHKYLLHMFLFSVLVYISIAPVSFLTPLQTVRTYGEEVWRLTALEITFSAGMLVGGLLISAWGGLKNRVYTMGAAILLTGALTVMMGLGLPFWLYLGAMVLCGLTLPFFNTPAITMLQEKVDGDYLGRVFSVLSMISSSMMPLGMLIFGPLADRVPIEVLLIVSGGVIVVGSALMGFDKTLVRAGVPGQEG